MVTLCRVTPAGRWKMTDAKADIRAEIADLLKIEVLTATNSGTYGASEACRKTGTGDPAFATRNEYETVAGAKRSTGPDADSIPGYMRPIGAAEMHDLRLRLADLRRELRSTK